MLPFIAHLALISVSVLSGGGFRPTPLDVAVNSLAALLLAASALALRFRPELAAKLGALTWSLAISLGVAELTLRFALPERLEAAPWPPVKQVSTPADTMPGITGPIVLSVNPELGLRATREGFESADLRILCLGGSSTECLYVTDDNTWPRLLQEKLSQTLGIRVFVGNGGRSGHFTLHTIEKIRNYSAFRSFDLVVVMTGINDMVTLILENYEERERSVADEALFRILTQNVSNPPYYARSRMWSEWLYYRRVRELNAKAATEPGVISQDAAGNWYRGARELRRTTLRENPRDRLPEDLDVGLDRFRGNIRTIIELCRSKGKPIVFVTQPTLYEQRMPQQTHDLIWGGVQRRRGFAYTDAALTRIMKAYNDVLIETCAEEGVPCIDLAAVLPKDTSVFYDDCHFNINGCSAVASVLAEDLLEIAQTLARVTTIRGPEKTGGARAGANG